MIHDPQATKEEKDTLNICNNQSFPLSTFAGLRVTCGSRDFTPSDGYKTFSELYAATEQCINSLCDLSCSGYIDYATYKAAYTQHADISNTSAVYGLCLMGINLEKSVENDDSTINNGISSQDGFSQFDIQLTTSSALATTSKLLTNVVHKRALVFSGSGVAVEF
jgi:hypothetical protein